MKELHGVPAKLEELLGNMDRVKEIARFMLIFFMSVFGFGIVFYSLYGGLDSFNSVSDTSVTLFSAAMGGFDLNDFKGQDFSGFGQVLMVLFVIWSLVLLLNLVVARMTVIHDHIDTKALDQYAYNLASNCRKFTLVDESAPVCMLPPPLNIIPILGAPIHFLLIKHAQSQKKRSVISLNGGICDRLLGVCSATLFLPLTYLQCLAVCIASFKRKKFMYYLKTFPHILATVLLLPLDVYLSSVYLVLTEDWIRISLKDSSFNNLVTPVFHILNKKIPRDENQFADEVSKQSTHRQERQYASALSTQKGLTLDSDAQSTEDDVLFSQTDRDRIFETALGEIERNLSKNRCKQLRQRIQQSATCDELEASLHSIVASNLGGAGKDTAAVIDAISRQFEELQSQIAALREAADES